MGTSASSATTPVAWAGALAGWKKTKPVMLVKSVVVRKTPVQPPAMVFFSIWSRITSQLAMATWVRVRASMLRLVTGLSCNELACKCKN